MEENGSGAVSWEVKSDSCIHSCFGVLCADDLAAKANVLIDPAELQAVTMDDLDEDEESATSAAQVSRALVFTCGAPCAEAASPASGWNSFAPEEGSVCIRAVTSPWATR